MKRTILAILLIHAALCSDNTGPKVADLLIECYDNSSITTRDYRLPSTINTLLGTIRKLEDAHPQLNARAISLMMLHRFRQDGIVSLRNEDYQPGLGLPYTLKGDEYPRNGIQLNILTPEQAFTFENDSLTLIERCSLHYMISSTIEAKYRDDEEQVCNSVARYQSRTKREPTRELLDTPKRSNCPIESGIIYTPWGAVKAGLIIAGAASGLQLNPIQRENGTIDNRYGSTIAAELSEVALYQPTKSKTVGNHGSWNSTLIPKYYFLENSDKKYMQLTDAEIRGGLDGLAIALNIDTYKDFKLSQIIDLYYSSRGLKNNTVKACNRKSNIEDNNTLHDQVYYFNYLLYENSNGFVTNKSMFKELTDVTIDAYTNYLNNLQDVACPTDEDIERISSNIVFFIDTAWDYNVISKLIANMLDNMDVNQYETVYSIYNGQDGNLLINRSSNILDFYQLLNQTYYNEMRQSSGSFSYSTVVQLIEGHFKQELDMTIVGNNKSTIALLLPHQEPTSTENELFKNKKKDVFRRYLPNLRIIAGCSSNQDAYNDLVTNSNVDVFTISENDDEQSIKSTSSEMIDKLRKIPRNIINPLCKSTFTNNEQRDFSVVEFVEPLGISYTKISPHYYKSATNLKIKGEGYGTVDICISQIDPNPRNNLTGVVCTTLTNNQYVVDITNYCNADVVDCQPIYISARAVSTTGVCKDDLCRFSDSVKYTVTVERARCPNSASSLVTSTMLLGIVTLLLKLF